MVFIVYWKNGNTGLVEGNSALDALKRYGSFTKYLEDKSNEIRKYKINDCLFGSVELTAAHKYYCLNRKENFENLSICLGCSARSSNANNK